MKYKLWSLTAVAALALTILLLVSGCNRGRSGSDVLARVNGRKITAAEVDKFYRAKVEGSPEQPSEEQVMALKLSILRDLIDNEILMQRAEKLGLLATDGEVDAKLAEDKAPFTKEEFDAHLKERGITLDDFRRDLRRSLTIEKVMNREITSKIDISDNDITSYYNQNKAEFNLIGAQDHLAEILVTFQPNPEVHNLKNDKAQNEAEAKKKVQMLISHLESGDDFATLAMSYSEHPETAANGGDLNFMPESELQRADKTAYDAISHLKPGQYTQPLPAYDGVSKSPSGYRIIKLIAREAAGQRDLSDPRVQQSIRNELRFRREQLLKSAYYESLRNNASIENYLAEDIMKKAGTTK